MVNQLESKFRIKQIKFDKENNIKKKKRQTRSYSIKRKKPLSFNTVCFRKKLKESFNMKKLKIERKYYRSLNKYRIKKVESWKSTLLMNSPIYRLINLIFKKYLKYQGKSQTPNHKDKLENRIIYSLKGKKQKMLIVIF